MTVRELFEYMLQCDDNGFGSAEVLVCDNRDNPTTDGVCIMDALCVEWKDGASRVVLQTG